LKKILVLVSVAKLHMGHIEKCTQSFSWEKLRNHFGDLGIFQWILKKQGVGWIPVA
jgi:hypothetical protein